MTTTTLSENRAAAVRHLLDNSSLKYNVWTGYAFELNGHELKTLERWYDLDWTADEETLARVAYGLADLDALGKFINDAATTLDEHNRRVIAEALDLWMGVSVVEGVRS